MDKSNVTKLKLEEGLILREVGGNYLVINLKNPEKGASKMITLNSTGAFLWGFIEKGATEQQLIDNLVKEYEVSNEIASLDVKKFIKSLTEAKLLK